MVQKTAPGGRSWWGIALIAIGVLWLFTSLGWFSWDFWADVWLLWPLVLILLGLNFLLRDNPKRIPVLLAVALVGGDCSGRGTHGQGHRALWSKYPFHWAR